MLELGINIYKAAAMPASQPGADRTAMEGRMTEMQRENSKATQQLAGDADQVHSVICIHHDGYECLVVTGSPQRNSPTGTEEACLYPKAQQACNWISGLLAEVAQAHSNGAWVEQS